MAAASGRRERWTAGRRSTSPCNARTERHPMTDRAILLVEDNPDDEALTLRAFKKHNITNHVVVAHDGAEALEYLFGTGRYAGRDMALTPQLILLDLNVEDAEDAALLLVHGLRRGGFEPVFERMHTPEALRAALAHQEWDIIFADYSMPHFSGTAALALVRERGLDLPFIFVSGTIGEDTAVEAMRAGAQDYVTKGNLKRLLPAVERELQDARERRDRKRAEAALRVTQERLRQV